ncbi:helix-turn-helix domain-containing protein [Aurantiacibacter gilvus]|uniref:Short-chain fatty acyl-CoA regulator family protein n=1 Tax=Aurantiacibacter gilvus TaxID=3139141 RepID=A0ABU9ID61_9SPHN
MAGKTLYLGPRLKKLRRELGLTQANMAADLEISASYIALMERNQRPVTAEMLIKLATTYRIDVADLADQHADETAARLQSALRDPLFADIAIERLDIEDIATSYPGMAEALLRLYTAFGEEQLALATRRESAEGIAREPVADPVVEARAFLSARRNCFPPLDDSAAAAAKELDSFDAMQRHIADSFGLDVRLADDGLMRGGLRWHDYHRRRIHIAERLDHSGRRFQLALQIAILEQGEAIEGLVAEGRFAGEGSRSLVRRALQSYWAAALLMPYRAFRKAAEELRYDVEALAARFSVSFEQAAHRLTTLQKPGEEGVPFFFLRVDRAGNVSKRLDGAGFPLAQHGGGCPLWNVHQVFATPGLVDAQLIEMPDGERYVSIARVVRAGGGSFGKQSVPRAIAIACSAEHLDRLAYADALNHGEPTPIGVACRLCHRPRCIARSAPPMGRELVPARFRDSGVPFDFSAD